MSPTVTKFLIGLGVILTAGALAFIIYNQHMLRVQQNAIQTQMVQQQQLVDGIVRSQSQWATKDDMKNFASANGIDLKAIQDNLDKLSAQVASINTATVVSQGQNSTNVPSTSTGPSNPNPNPTNQDPYGYQKKEQDLALNEDFGSNKVPIGNVGFSAWQKNPWTLNISPREYDVSTVVGVDENQRQYFYNKFNVKVDGKTYEVPIKNATTKQEFPTAKWSWWNPRALMGVDGGVNISHVSGEVVPHLGLGIMSYGQYKNNPDFSVLELGLGYEPIGKTGELVVTPVAYNIGKNLFSPFITNVYIGPSFTVATDGSLGVGLGLRVGL